ncbi:MAG: diguanylate cyclase [Magnetococcales bacterium]|nr:diguanylate cyclase [Magnetococcales bacterium]MBF0151778.1 diguanylate cyclase [Magnetococcales bacterium]
MTRFFSTIGGRILLLVGIVNILSMASMVAFYTDQQEKTILTQHEASLNRTAETAFKGLRVLMLRGYADIAQAYANDLKKVGTIEDFRILRIDGTEAFHDNTTIQSVNQQLGTDEFQTRDEEKIITILPATDPYLNQTLRDRRRVIHTHQENGIEKLTFLMPILAEQPCYRCHDKQNPVRGVLKLTSSLLSVQKTIQASRAQALWVLVGCILGSLLVVGLLVRWSLVQRINQVTAAMARVAKGDFTQQIPVTGLLELSRMAESFNAMTIEVVRGYVRLTEEQNKLTTVIQSSQEAVVVTNSAGEVVLINPAAERILEKSPEQLVHDGFLAVVDDPDYVKSFIERSGEGMPDTLVYKNRVLNFYAATICNNQDQPIGSAALIRDVTQEKQLEEKLRLMSYTDKLTGLYNRRRMEELLEREYDRARRYSLSLSILFFDVDHFKKFNDTYGHDMGDKVLEIVGQTAKSHYRNIDYACRYGGEEFCIILTDTDERGAFLAADRFRQRLEATDLGNGIHVTCSIGVVTFPGVVCDGWEAFLKLADNALYMAKRQGRNRVIQWQPGMPTEE